MRLSVMAATLYTLFAVVTGPRGRHPTRAPRHPLLPPDLLILGPAGAEIVPRHGRPEQGDSADRCPDCGWAGVSAEDRYSGCCKAVFGGLPWR
ncbi:hypothetical protein B0H11DRAFT_542173 [Mycena galericulata]|nr:hypothetical protein B0H11DRAFT_542173 [Mycena galericulata]